MNIAQEQAGHLESLIQQRAGGRIRHLRVLTRENGVILQGRAATYYAKQLAQDAVMKCGDLRIVANDIEVA